MGAAAAEERPALAQLLRSSSVDLTPNARLLRRTMTDAERRLWSRLRLGSLGVRFRRQVPIGAYIVDFACLRRKLIVELDGGQHLDGAREDALRDRWLREQGYRTLRFWNHEVLRNVEAVLEMILTQLELPDR